MPIGISLGLTIDGPSSGTTTAQLELDFSVATDSTYLSLLF